MAGPLEVVFFGTPDFAIPTLKKLADAPDINVCLVVTQPDRKKGRGKKFAAPPVKTFAIDRSLPIIQPVKAREDKCVASLKKLAPDFLVVVAYGQILPKSILDIPRRAPINLHASLLPRWRGAAPINRAIIAGDNETGVCTMLMAEGLDTGDVLLCEKTDIENTETAGDLTDRLATLGADLLVKTLRAYEAGNILPLKQDDRLATYANKLLPEDFLIDWSLPALEVSNLIRGLSPAPGAVTLYRSVKIKPLFAQTVDGKGAPGEILSVTKAGIAISCGEGACLVSKLKPAGKGEMTAYAFSLGNNVKMGEVWGE